jgi:hypothetical protein
LPFNFCARVKAGKRCAPIKAFTDFLRDPKKYDQNVEKINKKIPCPFFNGSLKRNKEKTICKE